MKVHANCELKYCLTFLLACFLFNYFILFILLFNFSWYIVVHYCNEIFAIYITPFTENIAMEISVTVYGSLYYLSRRVLLSLLVACLFVFNFSVCVWVLFFLRREIYSCRYQKLDLDFSSIRMKGILTVNWASKIPVKIYWPSFRKSVIKLLFSLSLAIWCSFKTAI